jgi:hypothetical protein
MSGGSGSKGDDGSIVIVNGKLGCPAVVNDHDLPKAILGVAPPSQDGFAVKGDFATCFVKKIPCSLHCTGQQQRGDC